MAAVIGTTCCAAITGITGITGNAKNSRILFLATASPLNLKRNQVANLNMFTTKRFECERNWALAVDMYMYVSLYPSIIMRSVPMLGHMCFIKCIIKGKKCAATGPHTQTWFCRRSRNPAGFPLLCQTLRCC